MNEKLPLLSICIPTYNRSKYLKSNLLSIFQQFNDNGNVEIIISDNNSIDETEMICKDYFIYQNFKYHKQETNIGGIPNIFKAVEYATGDYCWIIGDDDFLLPGSLNNIIEIIKDNSIIEYFYVKVTTMGLNEFDKYPEPFVTNSYTNLFPAKKYQILRRFDQLLDPKISIVFLGELMGSIFKRKKWMEFKNIDINAADLDTLNTTYPHSVIFANAFFDKKVIFIEEPMIIALGGARTWWDKVGYIYIELVKQLIDHYNSKGLSEGIRKKCYEAYINITIPYAFKYLVNPKSTYRNRVSFKKYFRFLFSNFGLTIKVLLKIIINYSLSLLRRVIKALSPKLYNFLKRKFT